MAKKVCILGSTGSIGTQALDVIEGNERLQAVSLVAGSNVVLLEAQAKKYRPELVSIYDEKLYPILKERLSHLGIKVACGERGTEEAISRSDLVLNAQVGVAGLKPTLYAIDQKKDVALANKETMVTAGELVMERAKKNGVSILPVDSEHSAIFQSLQAGRKSEVERLILTASGGPFLGKKKTDLRQVTRQQALRHPNWVMGAKVTIDSATLANKGLEVIEAMRLFDIPAERIKVLIHPQSIVHSMVEYCDGAVIAQMGVPDMRLPIAYALAYPERNCLPGKRLDFTAQEMSFLEPDLETFSALQIAFEAAKVGGVAPCVFNRADEEAVKLFLDGKIPFLQITELLAAAVERAPHVPHPSLEDIESADEWTKGFLSSHLA